MLQIKFVCSTYAITCLCLFVCTLCSLWMLSSANDDFHFLEWISTWTHFQAVFMATGTVIHEVSLSSTSSCGGSKIKGLKCFLKCFLVASIVWDTWAGRTKLASLPGHSQILSRSPEYSSRLQDKIWEWPGDEASTKHFILRSVF